MQKQKLHQTFLLGAVVTSSIFIFACDSSSVTDSAPEMVTPAIVNQGPFNSGLIDPEFQPTVDRFIVEAAKRNISVNFDGLVIQYGTLDQALGLCSFDGDRRRITMNRDLRNESVELLNEIILHELGHCVLNRDHSPDPTSIMHATNIIGRPWRTEVLDELFFGS